MSFRTCIRAATAAGRLPTLLLFAALNALPVRAGEVVNHEQVAACLADHAEFSRDCDPVIQRPCAHMAKIGLQRACMFRLRERWERFAWGEMEWMLALLDQSNAGMLLAHREEWRLGERDDCRKAWGETPRGNPDLASINRNTCRIRWTANWWHRLETNKHKIEEAIQ